MGVKHQLEDYRSLLKKFESIQQDSKRTSFYQLYKFLCSDENVLPEAETVRLLRGLVVTEYVSIYKEYHYLSPEKNESRWFGLGSDVFTILKEFLQVRPEELLVDEDNLIELWRLHQYLKDKPQYAKYIAENKSVIQLVLKELERTIERQVKSSLPLEEFMSGISTEYDKSWRFFGNSERNLQELFRDFILDSCRELYGADLNFEKNLGFLKLTPEERQTFFKSYALMRSICNGAVLFNAITTQKGDAFNICMSRLGKEKLADISDRDQYALLMLLGMHIKEILYNQGKLIIKWDEKVNSKERLGRPEFSLHDYLLTTYKDIQKVLNKIKLKNPETLVENVKEGAKNFITECSLSAAIVALANDYIMPLISLVMFRGPVMAAGFALGGPSGALAAERGLNILQTRVIPEVTAGFITTRCIKMGKKYLNKDQFDDLGKSLTLSADELEQLKSAYVAQEEGEHKQEDLLKVLLEMPDEYVSSERKIAIRLVLGKNGIDDALLDEWEKIERENEERAADFSPKLGRP